jgi:hypothetical protein
MSNAREERARGAGDVDMEQDGTPRRTRRQARMVEMVRPTSFLTPYSFLLPPSSLLRPLQYPRPGSHSTEQLASRLSLTTLRLHLHHF